MGLLIDTQVIVWLAANRRKLSSAAAEALTDGGQSIFVSAATAFEYSDLNRIGRFGPDMPLGPILTRMEAVVLAFPDEAWRITEALPNLHRDPVDRMTIAHALVADLTLITADATMRGYPVRTLW